MPLHGPKRVHIAPQGYEIDRVYKPPVENSADKVVLLAHANNSEQGAKCLSAVQEQLERERIDTMTVECNIFDFYDAMWNISSQVKNHIREEVFVNVSTGSKITAMAGLISCMVTSATPYYVPVEDYPDQVSRGAGEASELPSFPLRQLADQYLEVLWFIDQNDGVHKKELVEFAQNLPLLSKYNRSELKNMYEPVDKEIIQPLVSRNHIREGPKKNKKEYTLTESGREMLELFNYILETSDS